MEEMKNLVQQERFDIISNETKTFLIALDEEMTKRECVIYEAKAAYAWAKNWINAKYMINYKKTGVKGRQLVAHVFIKDDGIFLRLFALKDGVYGSNARQRARSVIDPHRTYIENAPAHIKELFTIKETDCDHTHEDENGFCWRLDTYTIDGNIYEKCIGRGFDFADPILEKLPDYIDLLSELNSLKLSDDKLFPTYHHN